MQPVFMSIDCEGTGVRIKKLIRESGYSVKDVQNAMGFENPQAVYKWLRGESLPSIDNLLILSKILNKHMESILVINGGDAAILYASVLNHRFNDRRYFVGYTQNVNRSDYETASGWDASGGNEYESYISTCQ